MLLSVEHLPGLENVRARLGLRPQDGPNIRPYVVVEALHARLSETVRVVEDEGHPGSWDVAIMAEGVHRMEALGLLRVAVVTRRLHVRVVWAKPLTPMVQLLPPVCVRWHSKLGAEPLVGPGIVSVLVQLERLISGKGDAQLLQDTSYGVEHVKGVAASEERVRGLEVVLKWNTTTGTGTPEGEVQLTLPPVKGGARPDMPSLICHCNVSSEQGILVLGEDAGERSLEVASLVVDHYFVDGQRELLLFEMAARPIFSRAINENALLSIEHWRVNMYITLTGIQNGEPVYLARSVGNPSACRGLEVALCELTYYHQWSNISAALGNN